MTTVCDSLNERARRDSRWIRPACWAAQVRHLFLYARLANCDSLMSDVHPLPVSEIDIWHRPAGIVIRELAARFVGTIKKRIDEARMTLALEVGVVGYDALVVYQCLVEGAAYTKGWTVMGALITQRFYARGLIVQIVVRSIAIFVGSRRGRFNSAATNFAIHLTTLWAMIATDPTSKGKAALVLFCAADVWAMWNLTPAQNDRHP